MFIFEAIDKNLSIWDEKNKIEDNVLIITSLVNVKNESALIVACEKKNILWVDFLLSLGANAKDLSATKKSTLQLLINKETPMIYFSALIELGADLNHQDEKGQSVLFYALHNQREDLTHLFLSEGANPDTIDIFGNCPLLLAAFSGNIRNLELLLESGVKLDTVNSHGQNALHMAVLSENTEMVKLLLESGLAVDQKDNLGRTALHYSATMENTSITEVLLKANININAVDKEGLTALSFAARQGLPEQVKFLLKSKANTNSKDLKNETTLIKALQQSPINCFQVFLGESLEEPSIQKIKGSSEDLSFLHEAFKVKGAEQESTQDENIMVKGSGSENESNQNFLVKGTPSEVKPPENFMVKGTPSENNLQNKFIVKSSNQSLPNQYAEVVDLLLKAGCHIEFDKDIMNNQDLFTRVNKNENLLRILTEYEGKKISNKLSNPESSTTIVKEVERKAKGEDPKKNDAQLNSEKVPDIENISPDAKDSKGTPYIIVFSAKGLHLVVEKLIKLGHDCKSRNKLGQTALMMASYHGHHEVVKTILKYDNNIINIKNSRGENALLMAILSNKVEVASLLLSAGAIPDVRYKGSYFLHIVAENGRIELAKAMLKYGANPAVKDVKGRTPAQYAKAKGFIELEGILGGPRNNS